ncbi:sialate O-acetylesterase [Spirosoma fluminis]
MKRLYGSIVLFLYYFSASGQVTFDKLPRDLQLYPREANNQADVVVSGQVTASGYAKISMKLLREGQLTSLVSQTLAPEATNSAFTLSTPVKAEPAEYSVQVFLHKATDSTLVAERKRIVCGDVYIIHGQSNALALAGLETNYAFNFDDKYLRNATYPYDSKNIPADMAWYAAKAPFGSVGGFGLTLQRLILQTYGIPTLVLNGAVGGTAIAPLSLRDPVNHANLNTIYGRLLFRTQWTGVDKHVKAIIWKQGEDDAGNGPEGYGEKFKTLYNQFREDYGDARIYVGQINILADQQDGAAALRDFQRRTKSLFKNVESIATVGANDYDGIHYGAKGHQQLAFEQFRQIARDFYGATDTLQIDSPDIKKVFYNARKDSLTLVFDNTMQMVWKSDTTFYNFATGAVIAVRQLKDYFYLDGQAGWVTSGSATQNRVTLRLKQPASAKALRYLPAYFSDATSDFYNGPTLRNTRGMRAFSFDGVPIAEAIPSVTTLAAKPVTEKQIQLNWTPSANAQTQVLERADGTPTTFRQMAVVNGTTATFADTDLPDPFGTYYYRLKAFSSVSESAVSNVVSARPLILGIEPAVPLARLYPNPLAADRMLYAEADQVPITNLVIQDLMGRVVKSWSGTARNALSLSVTELAAGIYVADLQTATGQTIRHKLVVH